MKNKTVTFRINEKENEMLNIVKDRMGYRMSEVFRIGLRKIYAMEVLNQKEEEQTNE